MPRTAGSSGPKTAQTIREASTRLFACDGYGSVSMRQIAEAVGVQASALYNHYPNKQALLTDLMVTHMQELLAAFRIETADKAAPEAALERFARFHIRYHITKPNEVFLAYMELRSLDPENFDKVDGLRRSYEMILVNILRDGRSNGVFKVTNTRVTGMAILAMLTGVTTWYSPGGQLSGQDVEDIYTSLALRSVSYQPKVTSDV